MFVFGGFGRVSCFQTLLKRESVWKQENDKILCWSKTVTYRGAPNDLESVWKQENNKILCWSKTVTYRGAPNDLESVWKQENDKILC